MFAKKLISIVVLVGVILGLTACGESGINDNKDGNSTSISDIEDGINSLADANTSTDVNISDINTSTDTEDISDINISDINNSIPNIGTGQYIDAAVNGVTYNCGNQNGVTENNGTFTFEQGKSCIFSLGNIVLRELNPNELEDKMIVVEDNIDNARLLQTLDNDGNADNGIDITKDVLNAISSSGSNSVPIGDNELGSFFQNIEGVEGYNGAMVSIAEAQEHLAQTAQELAPLLNQIPTEEDIDSTTNEVESMFDGL